MKMGEKRSEELAKLIGQNIKRLRMEHGESQQQLADYLGYGATTITNYESGYRQPDLKTFFMIAEHYNAELKDFLREKEAHES